MGRYADRLRGTGRVAALAGWLVLAAQAVAQPASLPSAASAGEAYKLDAGPYGVRSARVVLRDAKRGKDLHVAISYPDGRGPFPLIVFSHGGGGSGQQGFPLVQFWVSHGYVCLMPTHADSIWLRRSATRPVTSEDFTATIREVVNDPRGWVERPGDIVFLLDSLGEIQERVPGIGGRMDVSRIGVSGHSFGAFTTQAIGGATVTVPGDGPRDLSDPRPRALLMLSGQGRGQMGLTEHSWDRFTRPLMSVTGTRDRGARGQGVEWRRDSFRLSPAGGKYFVLIEGANHFSFTGQWTDGRAPIWFGGGGRRPATRVSATRERAIFDHTKIATIAYWDAYLKDDAQAISYLRSDALPTYSRNAVELERR